MKKKLWNKRKKAHKLKIEITKAETNKEFWKIVLNKTWSINGRSY